MDLLEIRKKAKEKKEAEARAREAESGRQPGEEPKPKDEPPPAPVKKRPKKKTAGKKADRAAKQKPEPAPEPEPAEVPGLAEALEDTSEELTPDEVTETGVSVAEEPAAVSSPREDAGQSGPAVSEEPEDVFDVEEEEDAADEDVIEYLAFMLSGEEYAVKVEDVDEIIRLQKITMVPRADDFVEGIISLRGVIIPVFDIKRRLGLDLAERGRYTRIVIVSDGDNPQGIIVDRVTGVARLRESSIEPPPAVIGGVEGEYLEGVGRIEERLLILFNIRKVLSTDAGES